MVKIIFSKLYSKGMVRAFLIGAGATKAQYPDAPLSADFFEKLYKKMDNYFMQ